MKVVNLLSHPAYYNTYRYEIVTMRDRNFIRYGKDLADSASTAYMMIGGVDDSTAVLAYGKPFIREGEGKGLYGVWKYVDDLKVIQWDIEADTITYREEELDFTTGALVTSEEHMGTYQHIKYGDEAGRFVIVFTDGKKTEVLPIVYEDIMYMFDLNPSWSLFSIAGNPPAFTDYKNVHQE